MRKIIKKIGIAVLAIGIATSTALYAENGDFFSPPSPPELNASGNELQFPPSPNDMNFSNNPEGAKDCQWNEYFNLKQKKCMQIDPVSLDELTTGVWLDSEMDFSDLEQGIYLY
jgi:hypothetical protein